MSVRCFNNNDTSTDETNFEDEPPILPIKELRETFFMNRNNAYKKLQRKVSFSQQELIILFDEEDPPLVVKEDFNNYKSKNGTKMSSHQYTMTSILKKNIS